MIRSATIESDRFRVTLGSGFTGAGPTPLVAVQVAKTREKETLERRRGPERLASFNAAQLDQFKARL